MPTTGDEHPWERRNGESESAYKGFRCYLDLGDERSVRKGYVKYLELIDRETAASGSTDRRRIRDRPRKMNEAAKYYRDWAKLNDWAERALEYDRYVERQLQKNRLKKIEEMRSRHQQQCEFTLDLLLRPAMALSKKYARNPQLLERMDDKELLRQFAIMSRRIPGIMGAERGALIGGNGQAPNVFEETKEADGQNQYIVEVLPSDDGRAPCESNPDDDLESAD